MNDDLSGPVLLVCADEARAVRWMDRLHRAGRVVVGPAPTASLALTLAMQAAPAAALLVGPNAGRRTNEELAGELQRLWGVPCYTPALPPEGQAAGEPGLPVVRFPAEGPDLAAA
ncbi:MAG: hypothetical protein JNK30_07390 [Phenylobacterium sp.]|uniref:hypothetical protein n=1 Tax=Phenylobacterium sp. TaxID=1871053 RepID=UPI001A4806C7|nr:hypothetical protein [Phenylobacterium sp.]MBL8771191.1 hypothetical protein [Phenylobacterium sp.]